MSAARFMLQRIREESAKGESFAFETTLANRSYAHSIREWQAAGYHVALWFRLCRALKQRSRELLSAYFRAGTIFRTRSFGVGLLLKSQSRRSLQGIGRRLGAVRQFRGPSRSC